MSQKRSGENLDEVEGAKRRREDDDDAMEVENAACSLPDTMNAGPSAGSGEMAQRSENDVDMDDEGAQKTTPLPDYLSFSGIWKLNEKLTFSKEMVVYKNFLNSKENEAIFESAKPYITQKLFDQGPVFAGCRFAKISAWGEACMGTAQRILSTICPLVKPSELTAYVMEFVPYKLVPDSSSKVDLGDIVVGVNIMAPTLMRFFNANDPTKTSDVCIPHKSVFIMNKDTRESFHHGILKGGQHFFKGQPFTMGPQLLVIWTNSAE